jgi:hypothetical protein
MSWQWRAALFLSAHELWKQERMSRIAKPLDHHPIDLDRDAHGPFSNRPDLHGQQGECDNPGEPHHHRHRSPYTVT